MRPASRDPIRRFSSSGPEKAIWSWICWSRTKPISSASGSSTRRRSASGLPVNGRALTAWLVVAAMGGWYPTASRAGLPARTSGGARPGCSPPQCGCNTVERRARIAAQGTAGVLRHPCPRNHLDWRVPMKDVIAEVQKQLPGTDKDRYEVAYERGRVQARSALATVGLVLGRGVPREVEGRGMADTSLARKLQIRPGHRARRDPVSQVAIDDTWSALRCRRNPALRAARAARVARGYRTANNG